MEEDRITQIKNFMRKRFDIEIGDNCIEKYDEALTHYNDDRSKGTREQERLAFLGDAYLEIIVREYLFNHEEYFSLEDMNDLKKPLVENDGWKKIATEIGLSEQIVIMQHGKRIEGEIEDKKILARSFEALAAVLAYDPNLENVDTKLVDLFLKLGYLSISKKVPNNKRNNKIRVSS